MAKLLILRFLFVYIGTLTSVFSTIVAMSKKPKTNMVTFREEPELEEVKEQEEEQQKTPITTTETNFVSEKIK